MGGLIVALLTAALVAPYFIDWTGYRADFEREAGRILGRKVTVEGSARARLLPFPSVTFTDVRVDGTGEQPAMTVDEFSMDAELAPFLRGEVLIFDMRLVHPHARIVIDETGSVDWAIRSTESLDPQQVRLEQVTVTGGSIDLVNAAGGRTHHLTDIDADLSARSLAGPWRVDGTLSADGRPTAVSVATGKADAGGMRVHLSAVPDAVPVELETDGRVAFDEHDALRYAGNFRLATRQDGEGQGMAQPADSGKTPGNRVTGRFTLASDRLSIEEFRLETGSAADPYTADGEALVDLGPKPRFSITADGAQINFDAPDEKAASGAGSMALDQRMASLRRFLLSIPKPTIPGTVRVNLPAIVAGDTTIRSIALTAEPAQDGWSIGSVAATLPGRTRFEGHGLLTTQDALGFKGSIVLAVRQPSGFAAWLARDVDEAIRRLPAAGFSADVDLGPQRQSFGDLELILGGSRFHGDMVRNSPADARPSMSVKLAGDKLDVEGMAAFASLFVSDRGATRLADQDIDFDIKAGPVSAGGLTADTVDTALRLQQGTLEIDRLSIEGLAGASVSATGTLKDFGASPTGKLDASIVAVDLEPLVAALAQRFPDNRLATFLARRAHLYPGLFEDAQINLIASAAGDGQGATGLALSANGKAGGTGFSLSASGSGAVGELQDAPFSADFTARNDEAAALYALYGLPAIPLGLAGAAESELSVNGRIDGDTKTRLTFTGQGLDVRLDGTARLGGEQPGFAGQGSLKADDLEPWLAAAGVALPGFGYGLPVTLSSPLDLHEGRLSLSKLAGRVAASPVEGNVVADLSKALPALEGSLDIGTLDLALPVAMVVGEPVFGIGADVAWPDKPFRQDVSAPFTADLKMKVGELYFNRLLAGRGASMGFSLDDAGLRLSDFSASLDGGRLSGLASLRNDGGSALLSTQFKLQGARLEDVLAGDALTGKVDLSASATASAKSVAGLVAALSGSGSLQLGGLTIAGFDPDAFRPIIARANAIGHEIKAADVARFAPDFIGQGRFDAGSGETAFTLAGGIVRTPPIQLHDATSTLTAELRADLPERSAQIRGSLAYDPGLEDVTGSDPTVQFSASGRIGDLQTRLDTQPLAQFLTQRALEREEARVEHMQAVLLEKQCLRREVDYYAALDDTRRRADEERRHFERESERMREEAERRAAEAERKEKAEEEARRKAQQAGEKPGSENQAPHPSPAPADGGAASPDIERRPLPPPAAGDDAGGSSSHGDDVGDYFDSDKLTVDGLMKLLGPRK